MPFGLRVFQVKGAAQGLQRVVIRLLELRERAGELCRPLFDELFQASLVSAILGHQATMLQSAANSEEQLIFFKGLQNVVISPATYGFQSRGNVVDRRYHYHRDFR